MNVSIPLIVLIMFVAVLILYLYIKTSIKNGRMSTKCEYLEEQEARLLDQIHSMKEDEAKIRSAYESTHQRCIIAETHQANLQKDNANLQEKLDKTEDFIKQIGLNNAEQFEKTAQTLIEQYRTKTEHKTKETFIDLIAPLKEKIISFENSVRQKTEEDSTHHSLMAERINNLMKTNHDIQQQTEKLASAIKGGDIKMQGQWGEIILERILTTAGLEKGKDYQTQGTSLSLMNPDNEKNMKPDVVILLPENKHIIIDSKLSLTHYMHFAQSTNDKEKENHLKNHIESIKRHIKELSDKNYPSSPNLNTLDFTLMFMPIEGAYLLAIQHEYDLHHFASQHKIILVSTSTLLATLKTIESFRRIEKQNQNAEKIAQKAGSLYDKIYSLFSDIEKTKKKLDEISVLYDNMYKKISSGKGNLFKQTEELKALGAKTTKSISKSFTPEDKDPAMEDEEYIDIEYREEDPEAQDEDQSEVQNEDQSEAQNKPTISLTQKSA